MQEMIVDGSDRGRGQTEQKPVKHKMVQPPADLAEALIRVIAAVTTPCQIFETQRIPQGAAVGAKIGEIGRLVYDAAK